jgi:hypothetical protein
VEGGLLFYVVAAFDGVGEGAGGHRQALQVDAPGRVQLVFQGVLVVQVLAFGLLQALFHQAAFHQ